MSVQKYRLEKAWSQEELAFHAGVSVRTIQRIESGKTASLETLKCLAAVLETNVSDLMTQERTMSEKTETQPENTTATHPSFSSLKASREAEAIEHVKNLKGFLYTPSGVCAGYAGPYPSQSSAYARIPLVDFCIGAVAVCHCTARGDYLQFLQVPWPRMGRTGIPQTYEPGLTLFITLQLHCMVELKRLNPSPPKIHVSSPAPVRR